MRIIGPNGASYDLRIVRSSKFEKELFEIVMLMKESHIQGYPIKSIPVVYFVDMPWAEHHILSGVWMYSAKQEGRVLYIHSKMNDIKKFGALLHEFMHYLFDTSDDVFVHKQAIRLAKDIHRLAVSVQDNKTRKEMENVIKYLEESKYIFGF
jgi:hypothetical protein